MSQDRYQAEVMDELLMREMRAEYLARKPPKHDADRDTEWACMFCGKECGSSEPATFICCGEIGHTHLVYSDDGEPVDD